MWKSRNSLSWLVGEAELIYFNHNKLAKYTTYISLNVDVICELCNQPSIDFNEDVQYFQHVSSFHMFQTQFLFRHFAIHIYIIHQLSSTKGRLGSIKILTTRRVRLKDEGCREKNGGIRIKVEE